MDFATASASGRLVLTIPLVLIPILELFSLLIEGAALREEDREQREAAYNAVIQKTNATYGSYAALMFPASFTRPNHLLGIKWWAGVRQSTALLVGALVAVFVAAFEDYREEINWPYAKLVAFSFVAAWALSLLLYLKPKIRYDAKVTESVAWKTRLMRLFIVSFVAVEAMIQLVPITVEPEVHGQEAVHHYHASMWMLARDCAPITEGNRVGLQQCGQLLDRAPDPGDYEPPSVPTLPGIFYIGQVPPASPPHQRPPAPRVQGPSRCSLCRLLLRCRPRS